MDAKFARVAAIAARQHGRITTAQLRACGVNRSGVEKAVRAGRLHRVHRGVYAVGHVAPSREGEWMGAVLACGPHAWLSARCAATAFGIRDGVGPRIDVTIPGTSGRKRPGIAIHHADLLPFEVDEWRGIPITSPSRTMIDLAHALGDREQVEWALRQLQFRRLYDHKLLELSNARRPSAALTALLRGIEPTRSPLEIAFLRRVVQRHGLPMPLTNVRPAGFLVDFLWPSAMVIVETDGRQHDDPLQRQADEVRDAFHDARGYRTLRYRWSDVHVHHARTAAEIDQHLRFRHLLDA